MWRAERRLTVFENKVLRRIFWFMRDEVSGDWRKLHNEEINDLYSSPHYLGDQIEKNEMGRHVVHMGERRGVCRVVVGKPEGKRPLGSPSVGGRIIVR
jgi:hypothetical protein